MNGLGAGMKLGEYTLDEELGRGPSATTWLGKDQTGQPAVLKILDLTETMSWSSVDVFHREADALRHLSHRAIPQYLGSFEAEDNGRIRMVIAMEHIPGMNLEKIVASGRKFAERDVERILAELCEVLAYLGTLRPPIVHRDINPRNIIMRDDGSIALVDFSGVQDAVRIALFPGATLVGTAGYIPLEQVGGKATHRSDLYGAAATAVFLLTGRNPSELPTRGLKIDIAGAVEVSPQLESVLSSWLEPDVSLRTLPASQAAEILRGRRPPPRRQAPVPRPAQDLQPESGEPQSVFQALRDSMARAAAQTERPMRYPESLPEDSKIRIDKDIDISIVHLPKLGLRGSSVPGATFSTFWVGFIAFWTFMTLRMRAPIFFPLFSIPFWLVGAALMKTTILPLVSTRDITITRDALLIKTTTFGMERVNSWPLQDIGSIKVLPSRVQSHGYSSKELVITAGTGLTRLGNGLSERELLYVDKFLNEEVDRLGSRAANDFTDVTPEDARDRGDFRKEE